MMMAMGQPFECFDVLDSNDAGKPNHSDLDLLDIVNHGAWASYYWK